MIHSYKKKLIEVAIPLEAINLASQHEKSIRQGHPSSLHQYWARRPLAACRAVLFAQLVDDPSSHPERFPSEEDQRNERERLFGIIEQLVLWENSSNQQLLEAAQKEIRASCGEEIPAVYDPFSGAASIPLEAQRLGLPSYGSDLNPVAVLIGKGLIEFPSKFNNQPAINPSIASDPLKSQLWSGMGAQGLAADLKYYGDRVRDLAVAKLSEYYPEIDLPKDFGGGKATVIAWVWARTVRTPNPAFFGAETPLIKSTQVCQKKDKERWVEVKSNSESNDLIFQVVKEKPKLLGTLDRTGAVCVHSGDAIPLEFIREEGKAGRLGAKLMCVVAEGPKGRIYLSPNHIDEEIANNCPPVDFQGAKIDHWSGCTNCVVYGLTDFADLFTRRQIHALTVFSDCIRDVRAEIVADAARAGLSLEKIGDAHGGVDAELYATAIQLYLSFALDKLADLNNSLCRWEAKAECPRNLYGKQAIPMVWDFAESNPLSSSSGSWQIIIRGISNSLNTCFSYVNATNVASINQASAQDFTAPKGKVVISTDPPYYDNIPYSNLSDFFYIWLKRTVGDKFPLLFSTVVVPRSAELVANQFRHGSKHAAEDFFMNGMKTAISRMVEVSSDEFPATIFYAFKQSEVSIEGITSKGWSTFLEAVISAGYAVVGTWPMRTENSSRMMGQGNNALANSVVLVCRKKDLSAEVATRADFVRALRRELPAAIKELQEANIAPADMPQSAIGPGMGIYSRYKAVLEADDSPMNVKSALQLINRELDEYLGGIQGEFDADTRFAITWFEQNGLKPGDYGIANNIATARGISVESVKHAGIVESQAGKVRVLRRDELDDKWEPGTDQHLTIWECLQHLVRLHEKDGISYATAVLLKKIGEKAEAVKDLAYILYDISANKRQDAKEATAYNALIADWTELSRQAASDLDTRGNVQQRLDL
jgi:putative DNA methylase